MNANAKESPRIRLIYVLSETGYVRYKDAKRLFTSRSNMERIMKKLRDEGLISTEGENTKRVIRLTMKGRTYAGDLFPNFEAGVKMHRRTDDTSVVRQCVIAKALITMMHMGIQIRRTGFTERLGTFYVPGKTHFKEMIALTDTGNMDVDRICRGGRRAGTLVTEYEFFNVHQLADARVRWEDAFEHRQVAMIEAAYGRKTGLLILADSDKLLKETIEYQRELLLEGGASSVKAGLLKSYLPEYYDQVFFINSELRTYHSYPDDVTEIEETGYAYAKMELRLLLDKRVREYVNEQCVLSYDRDGVTTVSLLPMDMRKICGMYIDRDESRKYQMVCPIPYMDILREMFPNEERYQIIGVNREIVYDVMASYGEEG